MNTVSMRAFRDELIKIAVPTGTGMLPPPSAAASAVGAFPRPSKTPSMSNINPWDVKHMSATASPTSMTAATVPPARMRQQMATAPTQPAPGAIKMAAELTPEAREKLPGKDFAVKAKKSNTGKEAYPIPDRQHAESALGFSKMHGDKADISAVRAKVKAKYPDMLKAAGAAMTKIAFLEHMQPGTERYHSSRMLALLNQLPARVYLAEEPEDEKYAGVIDRVKGIAGSPLGEHAMELAGLGMLAVPGADELQAHARAGLAGDYNKKGVKERELLPAMTHPLADVAGLGVLALPEAMKMMKGAHQ